MAYWKPCGTITQELADVYTNFSNIRGHPLVAKGVHGCFQANMEGDTKHYCGLEPVWLDKMR